MGLRFGGGLCCCEPTCPELNDNFSRATSAVGDDWEQVAGSWFVDPTGSSAGNLKTTDADAVILWSGTYRQSEGISLSGWQVFDELMVIVDWVDANNFHFASFHEYTRDVPAGTGTFYYVRLYKKTAGVDTLLYEFSPGLGPGSSYVVTFGSGYFNVYGLSYPVTPHGGNRVGIGTTSAFAGTISQAGLVVSHPGAVPCEPLEKGCATCVLSQGAWDMAVTLKMSSLCSGGALAETTFVMPFAGSSYLGNAKVNGCFWFLDAGLPCGWAWMELELFNHSTHGEIFQLTIFHFNGSTATDYTRLYFTGVDAIGTNDGDCNDGPYPIKTNFGQAIRFVPGFGDVLDGGVFDVSVCEVAGV